MKFLKQSLIISSLLFAFSCSHFGGHKDCCSSKKSCCDSMSKECKDGKCKLDKTCCKDECGKCDGKDSCQDHKSCKLKHKKKA